MRRLLLAFLLFVPTAWAAATEPQLHPFPNDWRAPADSPASMADLLPRPAGRAGFITVRDGHLALPDGQRFRIWGINATGRATMPEKTDAPVIAAHLARCGINCMRFHFLDSRAPAGLIDGQQNDSQHFDAAQLDRFDFFVAELKKLGIYANINLNVGRIFRAGDGVPDAELLGFAKALTYFHPRMLELQRDYARQLLSHRNPYTGSEYRSEPAVALVELVNENSIVESWLNNRLLGENTRKNPGTWSDIPASYERELTALWNAWLRQQQPADLVQRLRDEAHVAATGDVPRLKPVEFAKASAERFQTEARFYVDLERRYFSDMQEFLRKTVGLKSLLLGTSDHNHYRSGYPLLSSTAQLDVVDGHVYWQHPKYITDPQTGKKTGFEIPNTPMVNQPLRSDVVELSRSAVAGKPYTVSEVNHPFPHEFACEGVPIVTAYAALHDWDGIFWYTAGHWPLIEAAQRAIGHFDLVPDSMKMSQIAALAPAFLRGDVQPARHTAARGYSPTEILESIRLSTRELPFYTPGFTPAVSLVHALRINSFEKSSPLSIPVADTEPFRSDTGELTWTGAAQKQGLVAVNTPRCQAVVGFVGGKSPSTKNLAPHLETPFAALTLTALDAQPIATARRLLLTATARVANTGMTWNAKRTSLEAWGQPPVCIETVQGRLTLTGLQGAKRLTARPLTANGKPQDAQLAATAAGDAGWELPLGTPATTWYLIEVER